jgi:hypothetical protein
MEIAIAGWLFFDPQSARKRRENADTNLAENARQEKRLFCTACRHPVTHQDERIVVQGGHEHTFTNPHGVVYHIGCFREAAGCAPLGDATTEYTWFKGYAWRIARCAHCRAHLGWLFQAEGEYFHGLITSRLASAGPVKD